MLPPAVDGIIDCVAGAILGAEDGRKARKGKKNLTLSPQTPSLFPFLPISYPFRRLLRRLWYCNFNFPGLETKKSVSFSETSIFP